MKTIKTLIFCLSFILWPILCSAQQILGIPVQTQVTCPSSGTAVLIIADGTNLDWTVHPEGTTVNIKVVTKIPGITAPAPTFEYTAGGYFSSLPFTDPTKELDCVSEGAATTVDVWVDHK